MNMTLHLKKAGETCEFTLILSNRTSDPGREEPESSACQEVLKVSFRARSWKGNVCDRSVGTDPSPGEETSEENECGEFKHIFK